VDRVIITITTQRPIWKLGRRLGGQWWSFRSSAQSWELVARKGSCERIEELVKAVG